MRDIVLAIIVFASLPCILIRPYYGIMMLTWISLMNPHRLTYGWAYAFPWAQVVGATTIFSYILFRGKSKFHWNAITMLLIVFWLFTTLTTFLAIQQDAAWHAWDQFSKIILISILTVAILRTKNELRWLMLLIVGSIGFYGLKGGIWSLLTGGHERVFGPPKSFIGSNNPLGLALNMIIPLCLYLAHFESRRPVKWMLYAIAGFSAISVIFTYSRGDMLGLIVISLLLLLKIRSRSRVLIVIVFGAFIGVAFWIAPDKWFDRQKTTLEYEQDGSAVSRLNAWQLATRIAIRHPLTGLGFACHSPALYAEYFPESTSDNDFHSIFFGTLGEHGFLGLFLFLSLLITSFVKLRKIRKRMKGSQYADWYATYADMLTIAIVGYVVSGTFLSLQYFDLLYTFLAIIIILDSFSKRDLQTISTELTGGAPADEFRATSEPAQLQSAAAP